MKPALYRLSAVLLVIAAITGVLAGLLALAFVWMQKPAFTASLQSSLDLTDQSLQATSDGLVVTEAALRQARVGIGSVENTLITTSRTISGTLPMIQTMSTMLGEELPNTIASTQTSLATAQTSAKLIEDVLTTVSAFTAGPLIPGEPYKPEIPLYVALGDLSTSLDPMSASLKTMQASLNSSRGNLIVMQAEFRIMADHVHEINTSLVEAQSVVRQYQLVTADLQARLNSLQARLPGWINSGAWVLTFWIVWFLFTQIGLLFQGIELLEKSKRP